MNLFLIDNYDSFTFNLVQQLGELGAAVEVLRNDAVDPEVCIGGAPHGLVISPGPGRPEQAGFALEVLERCAKAGIPVLGVCLGLQAIGLAFGAEVIRAGRVMHGKLSDVHHDGRGIFRGLPCPFQATRYHSLVVSESSCPPCLEVSARSPEGEVMGLRHRSLPVEGVQFHPESILTLEGPKLLANFVARCANRAVA
ncbi:MAG: aminodeoxychorismate/anthranilate synthase component II [Myxococcota bacterium]